MTTPPNASASAQSTAPLTGEHPEPAQKTSFAPDEPPTGGSPKKKGLRPRRSKLWLFVWLAFALQITAWYFWIKLASQHRVEEVPLATAPHAPAHENLSPDDLPKLSTTSSSRENANVEQAASVDDHDRPAPESLSPGRAANERLAQ